VSEFATSLVVQLQRAVEAVTDEVAKDGLTALKRVLDEAGFSKSSYLKDYEVFAHVGSGGITFEILLRLESVDIDSKKVEEAAAKATEAFEQASDRTYQVISRGGFNRVARVRDIRRPVPSALNRPKRTKTNLKQWGPSSSKYGPRDAFKGPNERKTDHKLAMSMPRDMNINREGRLSVSFQRQTRTTKSGDIHFPQGKFQGLVKKFVNELKTVVLENFAPELEKILKNYLSS
jgi:hypothetical protein